VSLADIPTAPWPPEIALPLAVLFGLLIGSFLNVVVGRLPGIVTAEAEGRRPAMSLAYPASHCPKCGAALSWRENLPLLSFLLQRGRCRHCAGRISWRYPILEALGATAGAVAVWRFGVGVEALLVAAFLLSLLALSAIDLEAGLLPDRITLPLLWLGLVAAAFGSGPAPAMAILGAAAGYAALDGLNRLTRLCLGRDGMGGGDAKLAAALGAWLGPEGLAVALLIAFAGGALYGVAALLAKRASKTVATPSKGGAGDAPAGDELPFGPWLALGGAVLSLAPEFAGRALAWLAGV